MSKEEGKKPEQVLWLEQQLGFELMEVETEEELFIFLKIEPYRRCLLNGNKEIIGLNLFENYISDISVLSELKNLIFLDLRSNKISDISVLSELKNLISLKLRSNQILDISILSKLKNITSLDIGNNQISDISVLSELKNITSLDIGNNKISDYSFLLKLENLTTLDISNNQISDYSFLLELKNLTSLDISYNQISDYSFLLKLKNLTSLNLNDNQISDISFLSELKNLTSLDISYNQISDISFLSELKNLTSLNLNDNQISDISFLSELKNLTYLNFNGSQVSDISVLSELKNLTSLHFSSNQISNISVLVYLNNLTSLGISSNQISDYCFLSELKNLDNLFLYDAQISDTSFLLELKNLTSLFLVKCQISDISFLPELKNLTSLYLSHIQTSDYSFLSELKNLTSLYLSHIQTFDYSFLSELKKLTSLSLSNNQISDISFLSELQNLTSLDISNNQISDINIKAIIKVENLRKLVLYDNPISYLPPELLSGDTFMNCLKDLRNYYQNQDFIPNKEIKVVILGNGMVGKSTLLNRFLSPDGDWEREIQIDISDRTEGIVIKENVDFKLEENKEVKLNIWDFGGQEVYHGTHRLFLNKDAVYIIVWALETDEQKEEIRQNLNYWLDYVQDLAIDSPVILVHSQCDKESEQDQDKIDEQIDVIRNSKYKNNITTRYLPFSAKTGEGLDKLNEAIKKATTTKLSARVETEIPEKWSLLRNDLRELRENENDKMNEISYQEYIDKCKKRDIEQSEAETVLLFLHRIGFLYYDEKLSKNIILNQTWAIEAIYEALKPTSIAKDRNGILEYERLKNFWIHKNYTETEVKTFIDFMVSSEICFCKEQQDYKKLENPTFIVPHYLPEPANSFVRWRYENSFYLIYKPQFFHKGIAERFLSRLGRLSNETDLWRDGIRIFSEVFKGEAFITFDKCKADEKQKEIFIRSEKYELLEEIKNELNKILDEGSQTKPSEKVTFFYSIDGKEFVAKEDLTKQIKDDNYESNIRTLNDKLLKVKDFAEKYRLGKVQKTVSKESDYEKEGKQNETLLMKEANNKVFVAEKLDDSLSVRIKRKINTTEKAILALHQKIENLGIVIDNSTDFVEIEKADQELENFENKLEEAQKTLEELKKGNFVITNSVHSSINKALKHIEEANYGGYFEEMDKVNIPNDIKATYSGLKGRFIAGDKTHDFHHCLSTFARDVNEKLG